MLSAFAFGLFLSLTKSLCRVVPSCPFWIPITYQRKNAVPIGGFVIANMAVLFDQGSVVLQSGGVRGPFLITATVNRSVYLLVRDLFIEVQ